MKKRILSLMLLACLALSAAGCGLLGISRQLAAPTPTPTPTPRPTIPAGPVFEMDELEDMNLGSGDVFTVRITQEYVAENVQGLASNYDGVTFAGSQVELEPDLIRFQAQATLEEANATITVTLEGLPLVVDGLTYFQVTDIKVGDDDRRSLGDIILEKTLEEALEDVSTENGIHMALEEARELDRIELLDVRVLEGEMLLTCRKR